MLQILAVAHGFDLATPFEKLPVKTQSLIINGESQNGPGTGKKKAGFRGVLGFLKQNLEEATSDSYREWLLNYMSATKCQICKGRRLRPESLAVKVNKMSIADFVALSVTRAVEAISALKLNEREKAIAGRVVREVQERLEFLHAVGLGYISLERSAATLSGGEGQRIPLAPQLGSPLHTRLYLP